VDLTRHLEGQQQPAPLSRPGIEALLQRAAEGQGEMLAACLGLLSPCTRHRRAALAAVPRLQPSEARRSPAAALCLLAAVAVAGAPEGASGSGGAAALRLSGGGSSAGGAWELATLALGAAPPHPAAAAPLCAAASRAPPADRAALLAAAELVGCLLPSLASQLVLGGQAVWAAALAGGRLGLHPSLSAAGGSLTMLEHFLKVKWPS
jgi:hypothetical protein